MTALARVALRRAYFASFACSQVRASWPSPVPFAVILPYRGTRKRTQRLAVAIGPDDDGSPCATIGFPEDF